MGKLDINQTYIKRCGFCNNDETFILRAANVNPMTDKDVRYIATQYVGNTEGDWCENCHKYTMHTRVAYNLEGNEREDGFDE